MKILFSNLKAFCKNSNINFKRINYSTGHLPKGGIIYNAEIANPVPPLCMYRSPVGGNGPQEQQQIAGLFGYEPLIVNNTNRAVTAAFNAEGVPMKPRITAHGQPLKSALASLAWQIPEHILQHVFQTSKENGFLNHSGSFINTVENQNGLMEIFSKYIIGSDQQELIRKAIDGISSDYADSIYIANDESYFELENGKNIAFVATYPQKAMQRMTEKVHTVCTNLKQGVYPILLEKSFEGMANLKPLPKKIVIGQQSHIFALAYESTRSELDYISEMNNYLKMLGGPLIKPIILRPQHDVKSKYYHQDCALNFCIDNRVNQTGKKVFPDHCTITDILNEYKPNGTVFIAKNSLNALSRKALTRLFKTVIELDPQDDPLIANVVTTKNEKGETILLVSDKITPQDESAIIEAGIKVLKFPNYTFGGGGSHQCMKNVGKESPPITPEEWYAFINELDIQIPNVFFEALKEHYDHFLTR